MKDSIIKILDNEVLEVKVPTVTQVRNVFVIEVSKNFTPNVYVINGVREDVV